MKMKTMKIMNGLMLVGLALALGQPAWAQDSPSRQIQFIVPSTPGTT